MAGWSDYGDWTSANTIRMMPIANAITAIANATNERIAALGGDPKYPAGLTPFSFNTMDPTSVMISLQNKIKAMIIFPSWLDTSLGLDFEGDSFSTYSAMWDPKLLTLSKIETLIGHSLLDYSAFGVLSAEYIYQWYEVLNLMVANLRIFGAFPDYNVSSSQYFYRGLDSNWSDCVTEFDADAPTVAANQIRDGSRHWALWNSTQGRYEIKRYNTVTTYSGWSTAKSHTMKVWLVYGKTAADFGTPQGTYENNDFVTVSDSTFHLAESFATPTTSATHVVNNTPGPANTCTQPSFTGDGKIRGYDSGIYYNGFSNAVMEWNVTGGFEYV
jgi:hypothetical protein